MTHDLQEPLDPTVVAQYVEQNRCPRYLKQAVDPEDEPESRNWGEAFGLLNLSLYGDGNIFEANVVEEFAQEAERVVAPEPTDDTSVPGRADIEIDESWNERTAARPPAQQICDAAEAAAKMQPTDETSYVLLYQAPLSGSIGSYRLSGAADLIALAPPDSAGASADTDAVSEGGKTDCADSARDGDSEVVAHVIDCKSATEERAAHRVQVTIYCALLESLLAERAEPSCRIDGAVLTKDGAGTVSTPFEVERFQETEWELFVETLLEENGDIDRVLNTPLDETAFAIDHVCDNCKFSEACAVRAVEQVHSPASLGLLGLAPAAQRRLREAGIDSLAALSEVLPRDGDPYPTDESELSGPDGDLLSEIEQALPGPVHECVQRAQAIRGEFDPEYPSYSWPPAIKGKGWVPLPDDRQPGWGNLDAPAGTLVHVPLVVRPDTTIDRVAALGACVTADAYDGYETIGNLIEAVPDDDAASRTAERRLLEEFLSELFATIEDVAAAVGDPSNAAVHFYTYTDYAEEALVDALERHDDVEAVRALRDLLGLRPGGHHSADQEMCSTVLPVLEEHFALTAPSKDLLAVVEQFDRSWNLNTFDPPSARPDAPQLRLIFSYKYLNRRLPLVEQENSVHVDLGEGPSGDRDKSPDGWAALRKRSGTQFPLEYIWAVTPKRPGDNEPCLTPDVIDDWALGDDAEEAGKNRGAYRREIKQFRMRGPDSDTRIQREDVTYLMERLSFAFATLIENVPYKDAYMPKEALDSTQLSRFSLGDPTLPAAVRDYLRMEFSAHEADVEDLYRQPLRQRLRTGRSLPVRCTDYTRHDDGSLTIEGHLAYEAVVDDAETARRLEQRVRARDSDDVGGGSWRVITPLGPPTDDASEQVKPATWTPAQNAESQRTLYTERGIEQPTEIQNSPPVLVEDLDTDAGTITLSGFSRRFHHNYSRYRVDHRDWTCPDSEGSAGDGDDVLAPIPIVDGGLYVLDPMLDDLSAPKAEHALKPQTISANPLADHLRAIRQFGQTPASAVFEPAAVNALIESLREEPATVTPTDEQAEFIRSVDRTLVMLQGPPGTGKTSGATAPALLARAYARAQADEPFVGVVTAPSHTAIDEVLNAVATSRDRYLATWEGFPDVELVRILPEKPEGLTASEDSDSGRQDVTYCPYTTEAGRSQLETITATHLAPRLRETEDPAPSPILLFATPSTLYRTLGVVAETLDAIDGTSAPAAMRHSPGIADLLCIDEASMLDLPGFLLAGSVLRGNGQTLLVGDYRQLDAIQHHDWDNERRRSVSVHRPYLSALDYVRWLTSTADPAGERHPVANQLDSETASVSGEGNSDVMGGDADD